MKKNAVQRVKVLVIQKKTFKCIQYTYIFEILKMEKIWRVWKAIKNVSE